MVTMVPPAGPTLHTTRPALRDCILTSRSSLALLPLTPAPPISPERQRPTRGLSIDSGHGRRERSEQAQVSERREAQQAGPVSGAPGAQRAAQVSGAPGGDGKGPASRKRRERTEGVRPPGTGRGA